VRSFIFFDSDLVLNGNFFVFDSRIRPGQDRVPAGNETFVFIQRRDKYKDIKPRCFQRFFRRFAVKENIAFTAADLVFIPQILFIVARLPQNGQGRGILLFIF